MDLDVVVELAVIGDAQARIAMGEEVGAARDVVGQVVGLVSDDEGRDARRGE
jgi:hypothetical protein